MAKYVLSFTVILLGWCLLATKHICSSPGLVCLSNVTLLWNKLFSFINTLSVNQQWLSPARHSGAVLDGLYRVRVHQSTFHSVESMTSLSNGTGLQSEKYKLHITRQQSTAFLLFYNDSICLAVCTGRTQGQSESLLRVFSSVRAAKTTCTLHGLLCWTSIRAQLHTCMVLRAVQTNSEAGLHVWGVGIRPVLILSKCHSTHVCLPAKSCTLPVLHVQLQLSLPVLGHLSLLICLCKPEG